MVQFCFSSLIKVLKKHAKDKKVSNEEFVGELFCYICDTCAVTNKNGENYWSSKEIASLLINRKEDVPAPIRQALLNAKLEKLSYGMSTFYDNYLNQLESEHLKSALKELYKADERFSEDELNALNEKDDTYVLVTYLLIETAKVNNKITETKYLIYKRGANVINFLIDDIIKIGFNYKDCKKKKIVVIPVDADFHMHVSNIGERPVVVSENTIHGKWLIRMQKLGYSESEIIDLVKRGRNAGDNVIGATSTISIKNTEFYLLAISKFNKDNVAHATKEDIAASIKALIECYDKYGNGYEMFIPLIGTGSSRAKLTHRESFALIKSTLIENINVLNGSVSIVIYTNDQINVEEFRDVL